MLDWSHRLVLRAVEQGGEDDSPALRTLIATGLVEELESGGYELTPAGRIALDARPSHWERIGWTLLIVAGALLLADAIAGWLS